MTQVKADLTSFSALQASRLQLADFERALDQGQFDPFPDGAAATGTSEKRAVCARQSGAGPAQIADAPLSGFDGALPDYIQEAMLQGIHNDNDSLHAFLGIFDKRLKALELQIRRAATLVASQDKGYTSEDSAMGRFARLGQNHEHNPRYTELILLMLSRSRSLENLQAILRWWTGHEATVHAHFDTQHTINPDSRTRISTQKEPTSQLGRGAILGKMGRTPTGHIEVLLECDDQRDFEQLKSNGEDLRALCRLITRYLRDPVPFTIYALVKHDILKTSCLSARPETGCRLGEYNILCPEQRPEESAKIKLTEILG